MFRSLSKVSKNKRHIISPLSNQGNAMEQFPNLPVVSGSFSNPSMTDTPNSIERTPSGLNGYGESSDTSIFSSSLPVLHHERCTRRTKVQNHSGVLVHGTAKVNLADLEEPHQPDELIRQHSSIDFDKLLPNEEEFFAGIVNDYDLTRQPNQVQDVEDGDIFGNGGGLELDADPGNRRGLELDVDQLENLNSSMQKASIGDGCLGNGSVNYTVINGEHPLGEHPSRTLFVRNINSSVEDSELRALFEQYGDIHTLYTACKHRGFVMISYYDIRDARNALRALQSKPLRRRKLDIHYSIPKENPSEKDINQGTLVIFNLDPSVTNEYVMQIFGQYGEIKEIRETPNKRHHKFIEFYDVRAAEAALKSLNRAEIAGKRIKLEHSRPGGARRNLVQQSIQYLDHDERVYRKVGSTSLNSPPGSWGQFSSPFNNSPLQTFNQSPKYGVGIPMNDMRMQGMDSSLPPPVPNSSYIAAYGNHQSRPRSFPGNSSFLPGVMDSKSGSVSSVAAAALMEKRNGAQFHWGTQIPYSDNAQASFWSSSNKPIHGFNSITYPHFNVGSAPPSVHFSHFSEVPQSSFTGHISSGSRNIGMVLNSASREVAYSNNLHNSGMMSLPRFPYSMSGSLRNLESEKFYEYNQSGVDDIIEYQVGNKQYELDLEKIVRCEDARTTLMLKNIPNKYTSKMLLAAIDENHKGTYDFMYLPIDFKNKCNVGYAFINMVSPTHIVPFYEDFNGKKWEKFNSEKVASLAYARIQGKAALITHFQNSSLMNEDKRCRPILFHSEEHGTFGQNVFSANGLNQHETYGNRGLEIQTMGNQYEKIDDVFTNGTGLVDDNTFHS